MKVRLLLLSCCHKHEKSCNWKPLLFIGFTISTGVAIRVATVVEFLDLLSWLLTYLLKSAGFTHTILPIAWVNFFNKFSVCCVFCPMLTLLNWKECFAKVLFLLFFMNSIRKLVTYMTTKSFKNYSQCEANSDCKYGYLRSRSDFNKSRNSGTYFTLAVTFIYFSWNQWAFKSLFSSQLHLHVPTFFFRFDSEPLEDLKIWG